MQAHMQLHIMLLVSLFILNNVGVCAGGGGWHATSPQPVAYNILQYLPPPW